MKFLIALIITVGCILGGYSMSSGSLAALWHPYEVIMIFGGATGIFIMSNTPSTLMETVRQTKYLVLGPVNKKKFTEAVRAMDALTTIYFKDGGKALEDNLEEPLESAAIKDYKSICKDKKALKFIADNFSLVTNNKFDSHELSEYLDEEIERYHHDMSGPSHALDELGDTMPGLGIVVAVLGIIISMGYIDQEPEVLGHYISTALFGTFAGIFAGYGLLKPVGSYLRNIANEHAELYKVMKLYVISVSEQDKSPAVIMEIAHKLLPPHYRITLDELKGRDKKDGK